MPTPSRGAATNRPDTSNANVAAMLRENADLIRATYGDSIAARRCLALADALDQQAAVSDLDAEDANWGRHPNAATILESDPFPDATPWKDRVAHGVLVVYGTSPAQVDAILRAAFPELAPND